VVALLTLIAMFRVRKRHPGAKKILGGVYIIALIANLMYEQRSHTYLVLTLNSGFALLIIGTMLLECGTTPYRTYFDWAIAWNIFFRISSLLLLVCTFWGVNSALRQKLGHNSTLIKVASGIVLGFIAVLTAALIGVTCYNVWAQTQYDWYYDDSNLRLIDSQNRLGLAYWIFYLLAALAGGALSIVNVVKMRSSGVDSQVSQVPSLYRLAGS
jgi:hypothetical protein